MVAVRFLKSMKNNYGEPQQSRIDRVIFWGITFIIIFAPLAFGSVHVWAYTFIEITIFSLLILFTIDRIANTRSPVFKWVKTPANIYILLFLAFILFQILPLSAFIVKLLSPHTYADKIKAIELLTRENNSINFSASWMPIAYYAHPLFTEILKVLAYAGMFFLTLNIIRTKKQADTVIYIFIVLGVFESFYAIYQVFGNDPKVWWWESRFGIRGRGSGTYIGANHFAGYLEMIIPLSFGFMISQISASSTIFLSGLSGFRKFSQHFIGWFDPKSGYPRTILLFCCNVVMLLGLLLSGSRGGIISTGIALIVMTILFWFKKRNRRYLLFSFFLILITFIYGMNIGLDTTLERFKHSEALTARLDVTRSIIPMLTDYPFLGVGWGNFRYLYPRYIKDFDQVSSSGYAHNDWAEAGIELGMAGIGILIIGLTVFVVKYLKTWRLRRSLHSVGIGTGVLAGMLAAGIHSFFDFNMHIPANPLTLSILMAIGYLSIHGAFNGYPGRAYYSFQCIGLTTKRKLLILSPVVILLGFCIAISGRHFVGEIYCPTEWNSTLRLNWNPRISDIQKAQTLNPFNAEYYYKEAEIYTKLKKQNNQLDGQYSKIAAEKLKAAIRLNPSNGLYWLGLGKIFQMAYNSDNKLSVESLLLADDCFDTAVHFSPKNPDILIAAGRYYVWRSTLSLDSEKDVTTHQGNIIKFQDYFRRAFLLKSRRMESNTLNKQVLHQLFDVVDFIWFYYPDKAIIFKILSGQNDPFRRKIAEYILNK